MRWAAVAAATLAVAAACGAGVPPPAALDNRHEACQTCRMIVSDASRASQIVAPYEEPRFFDDLSCLSNYLIAHPPAASSVIYVADHRTREWVRWDRAIYTRTVKGDGAMGSSVLAHASVASREADRDAAGGSPVEPRDVLPAVLRGGRQGSAP